MYSYYVFFYFYSDVAKDLFRMSIADDLVDMQNNDADRLKTDFSNHIKVYCRLGIFIEINRDVFRFNGKYYFVFFYNSREH